MIFINWGHLTAIPAVSGLRKFWPSSKRRNVEMWRAIVVVIISCFTICTILYTCMGYFGYHLFGDDVDEDILNNFEGIYTLSQCLKIFKASGQFQLFEFRRGQQKKIINDRFQKKCFYESCIKSQMIKIINVYSQVPRTFDIAKAEKGASLF